MAHARRPWKSRPRGGWLTPHAARTTAAALATVMAAASIALAPWSTAAAEDGSAAAEVQLYPVKPVREKLPTLRFLKENRDFIRAALDRLREKSVERRESGQDVDPRFLAYREMLAAVEAARDTAAATEEARARRLLLESVTRLGEIEGDLDRLERLLAEQRTRLGRLDQDFLGRQRTELVVVVSGYPAAGTVTEIALALGDGATLRVPLPIAQREALAKGAVVQLFHGLVEPRIQDLAITLAGEAVPAEPAFAVIDPPRDRLSLLRLDLSEVRPERGATSIRASIRQDDAGRAAVDG